MIVNNDVKDNDNEEYKICCSNTSKEFIKYITVILISSIVLIFSMVMIIQNPTDNNTIYFSLISHIIGIFIPTPNISNNTKNT